jgi:wyosine [tRNA(Phe)-imidazoG37] synthetase (radical SAM superfamily)
MRDVYRDFAEIAAEVSKRLSFEPDYITLTGAGDPALHAQLNQVMQHIKSLTDVPIAILTSGALFWRADVRAEALDANVVLASLDAGDNATLSAINRPHHRVAIDDIIEGLIRFRRAFDGQLRLTVTLVSGVNDTPQSLERIRRALNRIGAERVYLDTVSRSAIDEDARAVPLEQLAAVGDYLGENVEVLTEATSADTVPETAAMGAGGTPRVGAGFGEEFAIDR